MARIFSPPKKNRRPVIRITATNMATAETAHRTTPVRRPFRGSGNAPSGEGSAIVLFDIRAIQNTHPSQAPHSNGCQFPQPHPALRVYAGSSRLGLVDSSTPTGPTGMSRVFDRSPLRQT